VNFLVKRNFAGENEWHLLQSIPFSNPICSEMLAKLTPGEGFANTIHYVILTLPSSLFLMQRQKITKKCIVREKVNKLFFVNKQD